MYCRQNETCTICLERIEHILHVWKYENMSWNSFITEYLKLNRKKTAWMTRIMSLLERHELTVSLLQWHVQSVSLLQKQIMINLVIELIIEWMKQALLHICSRYKSIVSLLQWHVQ